jgi:GT2 family glycosyltransferase
LLNSDTVVCDAAIEKTIKYADANSDIAVVGCQVWETQDKVQMTCFRFPSLANLFLSTFGLAKAFKYNRILGREWMLWWNRDNEREVDVVSGMFMLVRRKAIDEIGIMDERFFVYCEEADWCYRFRNAKWKVLFWPGARIVHVDGGSHSSNQAALKMFVQKQKSLLIFLKKHRGRLNCWLGRLILICSFSLRVCVWAISLVLNKMACKNVHHELAAIQKNWTTFKFCALGLEPKWTRH